MVLIVLLVLALFVFQTLLPTRFREAPAPGGPSVLAEALGNRDHLRPHTVVGRRAAARWPTCTRRCRCSSRWRC